MTAGRPSKYKEKYNKEVIDYMEQGYSKEAFAGKIGVSRRAIFRWIKRYPKFRHSIKIAEVKCQKFWEELGLEIVLQGQGNPAVWIYNMKCRFGKYGWIDKTITDVQSKGEKLENLIVIKDGS